MNDMKETEKMIRDEEYRKYVKEVTPTRNLFWQMLKAFLIGGIICIIGQFILNMGQNYFGFNEETAAIWCTIILIAISCLMTGFGWYTKLAGFAGAGALVPITGFANSVAAPAIEFKKEGQVFGIGCKIFTIAGPVILYGIVVSFVLGFIYWLLKICGIVG